MYSTREGVSLQPLDDRAVFCFLETNFVSLWGGYVLQITAY